MDAPFGFDKIGLHQSSYLLIMVQKIAQRITWILFLTANTPSKKNSEVFMNSRRDIFYTVRTQYHFSPDSDWKGQTFFL